MRNSKTPQLLRKIKELNRNTNTGVSVYFKTISADIHNVALPRDFCNTLACGKCEYVEVKGELTDISWAVNLSDNLD